MKKFNFEWETFSELVCFYLGTYGERIFVALHAFICNMNPKTFSFICLTITCFVIANKTNSKK